MEQRIMSSIFANLLCVCTLQTWMIAAGLFAEHAAMRHF